jgi:Family of unknown function (DUF5670)
MAGSGSIDEGKPLPTLATASTVEPRVPLRVRKYAAAPSVRNLHTDEPGVDSMLETIVVLLVLLWALGMLSSYTVGGLLHLLLVLALVVVVIRVLQGRRVV